jgi:hypothetical protein
MMGRYINCLAEAIMRNRGIIYEETKVMRCEWTKVMTEEGLEVTGNELLMATNSS